MNIRTLITKSTFVRHNAILFAGSVAVGVANYAYYPVLGRLVNPSTFGEIQTLVSLFLQLTIFLTVLSLVAINVVVNYRNAGRRNGMLFDLEKTAVLAALLLLVVVAITAGLLQDFLHFTSSWPFVVLTLALVVSVPFTFRSAFLRGKQAFMAASFANLITAVGKLMASAILVVVGFGTTGAMAGLVISQAVAFLFAAWQARRLGLVTPAMARYVRLPRLSGMLPELSFGSFVLMGSLAVTLLFSVDVIVVKHFFDAHTAGLYAGVSTVGRIIFFLTASVAQVLLPAVKLGAAVNDNRALLAKSLLLVTGISSPVLAVCLLLPQQTVTILMGQEYASLAYLLPWLVVANFTISIINLLMSYFLALRRIKASILGIIGFAASLMCMIAYHDSLQSIVTSLALGSVATLCLIAIWIARGYLKRRNSDETTTISSSGTGS